MKSHYKVPPKRQQSSEINVDKQKEQPRISKKIKFNENQINRNQKGQQHLHLQVDHEHIHCQICTQSYNLNRRIPVIACSNKHTYCLNCIVTSVQMLKPICPMCRQPLQPKERNEQIYQSVLKTYEGDAKISENTDHFKLKLGKFGKKHSSIQDFDIQARKGIIIKINKNQQPSLLILDPQLKKSTIASFRFTYTPILKQQVSFGICVYDKFLCKIVSNIGFDTKVINFFKTKQQSIIVKNESILQISVYVDLHKNEIKWYQQRIQHNKQHSYKTNHLISSQSIQLSNKVGDIQLYPFIAMFNVGDTIKLNE